uniref:Putative NADH dehydrogenase n=1 Tax=viral metagenome TaxID=1070528 RepID=A0A6M3XXH1_9ZZZZ
MKILVLGSDGYIGYPLTLHLLNRGYEVMGVDSFSRRRRVKELGGDSLTPILSTLNRNTYLKCKYINYFGTVDIRLGRAPIGFIRSVLKDFKPNTIVHLAEQSSAPWSMKSADSASATQLENVIGTLHLLWAMKETCPEAHLVKLGTMGEYGTPECDIPEGFIPNQPCYHIKDEVQIEKVNYITIKRKCPMSGLLFPRTPGSFYHLSKVHDTFNIKFACDIWNLRSTDIMQGVVFGVKVTGNETEDELTRFDYDECFGTVINRFCTQAIADHPLTVYGRGNQQRGFLPLKDSIQCLTIAIKNPPLKGEYRTWNQFENIYSINILAKKVQEAMNGNEVRYIKDLFKTIPIKHIPNPRLEAEDHYYNPTHQTLLNLGYEPTTDIQGEITNLIKDLLPYKERIIKELIMPITNWR